MKKPPTSLQTSPSHRGAAAAFVAQCHAKGKVTFTMDELCRASSLTRTAARFQLLRLGPVLAQVSRYHEFYVLVRADQAPMGAPPIDWWLHAYLSYLQRPYYVALLSAAQLYGASHQAVQITQVMTNKPMKAIQLGRTLVEFHVRSNIDAVATTLQRPAYAKLLLSTPEATCIDLVRHAVHLGGIGRAAAAIHGMLGQLSESGLHAALAAKVEQAALQRLGYVFDYVEAHGLAAIVFDALARGRRRAVPLDVAGEAARSERASPAALKWQVIVNLDMESLS